MLNVFVHALNHAVKGYFGSVWNVGEHSVLHIVVHCFQYLFAKQAAQLLALAVNRSIAAAREINPLKRTGLLFQRFAEHILAHPAVLFHNQGMAGLYLFNFFDRNVKGRLKGGPFGCRNHNLVILKVIGRAYAYRVAHNKGVAVAQNAGYGITAIPAFGRFAEDLGHIHIIRDQLADLNIIVKAFAFILIEQTLVFGIDKVAYFFKDGYCIGFFFRMLA